MEMNCQTEPFDIINNIGLTDISLNGQYTFTYFKHLEVPVPL